MSTITNRSHAMKILAIEGLDKAGKNTAALVLREFFTAHGYRVAEMSFPAYDTVIGQALRDWLTEKLDANSRTFELLQAADKQRAQTDFARLEADGVDIVIVDRYIHTQWAYGLVDHEWTWLLELSRGLRRPDAVLHLDVEPEVSMHRRGKFGDNDRYERDVERLRKAAKNYATLLRADPVPTFTVDANLPLPVVKGQVFGCAKEMLDLWPKREGSVV